MRLQPLIAASVELADDCFYRRSQSKQIKIAKKYFFLSLPLPPVRRKIRKEK